MRIAIALLLLVAVAPPGTAYATGSTHGPDPVKDWWHRLQRAHEQILEGKTKKARKLVDRVVSETRSSTHSDPGVASVLAQLSFIRALTAAADGDSSLAVWDLGVACALLQGYCAIDLTPYGNLGATLAEARAGVDDRPVIDPASFEGDPRFEPIRFRDADEDTRPESQTEAPQAPRTPCDSVIEVSVVYGEDGRTREPRFDAGADPIQVFLALEGLRVIEYQPATLDGRPVSVRQTTTVSRHWHRCGEDPAG
jgi:hypothetical protein